jgi:hypothetical protein
MEKDYSNWSQPLDTLLILFKLIDRQASSKSATAIIRLPGGLQSSVPQKVPRAQDGDPRSWVVEEFPGTAHRVERVQSPVVSTQGHPPPTQNRKLAGFAEISDRSHSTLGCSSVIRKACSPTHTNTPGKSDVSIAECYRIRVVTRSRLHLNPPST